MAPLLAVVLLLAFAFQGTRGLWEPDEGRYTDVALARHLAPGAPLWAGWAYATSLLPSPG